MSVSIWNRTPSDRLDEVDVCVIGAGVCGLCVAHELQDAGRSVAIVERHSVGSGASTRNAGFLMRGTASSFAAAVEAHGPELALTMWRWTEENLAILMQRLRGGAGIIEPRPSVLAALQPDELSELQRSHALLQRHGLRSRWLERGDDSLWRAGRVLGALENPHDACCDSRMLIDALASTCGARIHEQAEVFEIEPSDRYARVGTARGEVRAQHVVVCTNAWLGRLLPELAGLVKPNRGQMLAFDDERVRLDACYYINRGSEYMRAIGPGRFIAGGCRKHHEADERTSDDATTGPVQRDIEAFVRSVLGLGGLRVTARWAGTMGLCIDGLPMLGPTEPTRRIWACGGFTGHGMGLAARAARSLAQAMLEGLPSPLDMERFRPRSRA